jgi:hypothetical protein
MPEKPAPMMMASYVAVVAFLCVSATIDISFMERNP